MRKSRALALAGLALLLELGGSAGADPLPAAPLTINEARRLAASRADEARAKKSAAEAALGAVDAARARLAPRLSADVSGAYLVNPPTGLTVTAGSLGNLPLYNPAYPPPGYTIEVPLPANDLVVVKNADNLYFKGGLSFTQPLYTWGKIRAAVNLAAFDAELAGEAQEGAERDASRSADRAYFSARLAAESAAILAELRDLAEAIVRDRQSTLDEGLTTKEGLLAARADLADLEARLVEARESGTTALESLAALTDLKTETISLVSDFRTALPAFDETELKEASLASSTDFRSAQTRLAQARSKVDLEKGGAVFLPDLSLFVNFDLSNQSSSPTETWSWDISIGLAAKADLFDGGAGAARIREAEAGHEAAAAALSGEERGARLRIRQAIESARRAEALLRQKEARATWAAEALKNVRTQAENELVSRQELNDATIREAEARLDLLLGRFDLEEAIADLERLTGKELQ